MGFRDIYNTLKKMPAMGASQAMKLKQAAMMRPVYGRQKPLQPIKPMPMKKLEPMRTLQPKTMRKPTPR